jgi:hypothetical protein
MISDLKKLVSSTNPQEGYQRRDLKIPAVDSATVALISDEILCRKVLPAFLSSLPSDYPKPLPQRVYVVKAGKVYVVMHPPGPGETGSTYAVIDSKFKVVAKYSL